jgi:hypothetical protein
VGILAGLELCCCCVGGEGVARDSELGLCKFGLAIEWNLWIGAMILCEMVFGT